jgi:membrane protein DedA with SNARE-associated domain
VVLASAVVDWSTDVIDAIGSIGVAFLIALESVFPPIPSEAVLLLSGFLVSDGRFSYGTAVAAATVGSVAGALLLYTVGAIVGEDRMERLLTVVGKPLGFKRRDIDRANAWFERHGALVVLFGRMVPLVRSLVSLPAGADRMSLGLFLVLTTIGSACWNAIWIGIGWELGAQWERAERWTGALDYVIVAGVVGFLAWALIRRRRQRGLAEASG